MIRPPCGPYEPRVPGTPRSVRARKTGGGACEDGADSARALPCSPAALARSLTRSLLGSCDKSLTVKPLGPDDAFTDHHLAPQGSWEAEGGGEGRFVFSASVGGWVGHRLNLRDWGLGFFSPPPPPGWVELIWLACLTSLRSPDYPGTHYAAEANLELATLFLPQLPEGWDSEASATTPGAFQDFMVPCLKSTN